MSTKKFDTPSFFNICANLSSTLSSLSSRKFDTTVEYLQTVYSKDSRSAEEIAYAVLARIATSDSGKDRYGSWHLLSRLIKMESDQDKRMLNAITPYLISELDVLFEFRWDASNPDVSGKFEGLKQTMKKYVEHGTFKRWAQKMAESKAQAENQKTDAAELPISWLTEEIIKQSRRLREIVTLPLAIEIYERYGIHIADTADFLRVVGRLHDVDREELERARRFFDTHASEVCTECCVLGHVSDTCPRVLCMRCLKAGHSELRCALSQSFCPYCNVNTSTPEHFPCSHRTEFARNILMEHQFNWENHVLNQFPIYDEIVRLWCEGKHGSSSMDVSLRLMHAMDLLRGTTHNSSIRSAMQCFCSFKSKLSVLELSSMANEDVHGNDAALTAAGFGSQLSRFHKATNTLIRFIKHGGLSADEVSAIEVFKGQKMVLAIKNYSKMDRFEEVIADRTSTTKSIVHQCITRVLSVESKLCEHCLSPTHIKAFCPEAQDDKMTYDEKVACQIFRKYDWEHDGETNKSIWEDRLYRKDLTPLEHAQAELAINIMLHAPFCHRCRSYGHRKSSCLRHAKDVLQRHRIQMLHIRLFPKVVQETIHGLTSREDQKELEDAVRLLQPKFIDPQRFVTASHILNRLRIPLHTAQYFPEKIIDIYTTGEGGVKLSDSIAHFVEAVDIVSSDEFPRLCFACGDIDHTITQCKAPHKKTAMKLVMSSIAGVSESFIESALRRDVKCIRTREFQLLSLTNKTAVWDLFAAVELVTPTALTCRFGSDVMYRTEYSLRIVTIDDIPLKHVITEHEDVDNHLHQVKKKDPDWYDVLKDAVYQLTSSSAPPLCVSCCSAGHDKHSCPFKKRERHDEDSDDDHDDHERRRSGGGGGSGIADSADKRYETAILTLKKLAISPKYAILCPRLVMEFIWSQPEFAQTPQLAADARTALRVLSYAQCDRNDVEAVTAVLFALGLLDRHDLKGSATNALDVARNAMEKKGMDTAEAVVGHKYINDLRRLSERRRRRK